jgi:hypothetical protein
MMANIEYGFRQVKNGVTLARLRHLGKPTTGKPLHSLGFCLLLTNPVDNFVGKMGTDALTHRWSEVFLECAFFVQKASFL